MGATPDTAAAAISGAAPAAATTEQGVADRHPAPACAPGRGGLRARHCAATPVLPVALLTRPPYMEAQVAQQCLVHAFNMCVQHPLLHQSDMHTLLTVANHERRAHEPALSAEIYDTGELSMCLKVIDDTLRWHEGQPHLGRTADRTWVQTLQSQHYNMNGCDTMILTLRPHGAANAPAPRGAHHVAAVKLQLYGNAPDWYILDSRDLLNVQLLSEHAVATVFDADVSYPVKAPVDAQHQTGRQMLARAELLRTIDGPLLQHRLQCMSAP